MNVIERAKDWTSSAQLLSPYSDDGTMNSESVMKAVSDADTIITDLLSIVERLPVTADGVPITLGMKVWYIEPDYEQDVVETTVTALYPKMFEQYRGDCCVGVGGDWEGGNLECHSTRAAAEAAKEGE